MLDNVICLPILAVIYIVCTLIALFRFILGLDFGFIGIVSWIVFLGGAAAFLIKVFSEAIG